MTDAAETSPNRSTTHPVSSEMRQLARDLYDLLSMETGTRISKTVFEVAFEGVELLDIDSVLIWLRREQAITAIGGSPEGYMGSVWEVDRNVLARVVTESDSPEEDAMFEEMAPSPPGEISEPARWDYRSKIEALRAEIERLEQEEAEVVALEDRITTIRGEITHMTEALVAKQRTLDALLERYQSIISAPASVSSVMPEE